MIAVASGSLASSGKRWRGGGLPRRPASSLSLMSDLLRIQPKLNTALLSTVRAFVCHGRDISSFTWTVQFSSVQPRSFQHSPVQPSAAQYKPVQPSKIQYSPVQSSTAQYSLSNPSTSQYSPVQPSTIQCSLVQSSTAQSSPEQACKVQYSPLQPTSVH